MAYTKNALIRYKILDTCFRNTGKRYFIEDLINECEKVLLELEPNSNGISLRQIRDDISFMKSTEGWEIELGNFKDGKKMYYRYVDTSFSINNMPLNDLEINQMNIADVARKLPARRHHWAARLIEHKIKINDLEKQKSKILKEIKCVMLLKTLQSL
jgi:hypothetical protein